MTARAMLSESSRVTLGPPTRDASSRRLRRSARSLAEKKERKRAVRRFAKERAKRRAKYAAKRARKIARHGIENVRAEQNRWSRIWRTRHPSKIPRKASIQSFAAATQAALDTANGNQKVAAVALGISEVALFHRLNECTIEMDGASRPLRTWLDRTWPQRGGHRAVDVARTDYEPASTVYSFACGHESTSANRCEECDDTRDGIDVIGKVSTTAARVYVLAAHGDVAEGEHVNRVPAVGIVRARVVCQACKEARGGA